MAKCENCKWNDKECLMGLEVETCDGYAKPVEENCKGCEWYLGMGQCRLNLENECAEDGHSFYQLNGNIQRDCKDCDNFVAGSCTVSNRDPKNADVCQDYVWWPVVPNWGSKV